MKLANKLYLYNSDALKVYEEWDTPSTIISDGPYGVGGYPGDPKTADGLKEWYRPHIEEWTKYSTPNTTLWFWNTELGWANVHSELIEQGWEFVNCHIWDKGKAHIAGNVNTKTIRRFPVVTEVCVQYVKKAFFTIEENKLTLQDWLRYEWKRSGLPLSKTNEACGVVNAASRKYFTACHLWYYPPSDAFEKLVDYANKYGDQTRKPYFSIDGKRSLNRKEWEKMRATFKCEYGINNVWREPSLKGKERLKTGLKSLHLNQKPLKFMERMISSSTNEKDVVWEPFGGLFSAVIASYKLNRVAYSAEINKTVFEQGKSRIEEELRIK